MIAGLTDSSTDPQIVLCEGSAVAAKPKRALVVSFDFPPRRTSAVYRMTGLTGSLPQFGWQPTVLTAQIQEGDQERGLLEKLPPEIRVVPTRYLRVSAWENLATGGVRSLGGLSSAPTDSRQSQFDRCLRSIGELVRSGLYFPDDTVGWIPFALAGAIQLHRQERFDVVYTTSPPRAAPVVGLLLKVLFGIPWVSEFMDPWYPPQGRLRRRSENWLQALLMAKADRVVVMVPQHAEELERKFHVPGKKLAVVRNGFFEEDFASLEATSGEVLPRGYIHLSHFGTIYPENSGNFFIALAELVREWPELKRRLRVHIGGYPCESVLRFAQESELREIMQIHGFIPDRRQILQMMRASHCLLLFWGRPDFSRLAVAGKTYDYLRVGRPILAVTCEGGVQELVEQAGAGWVVSPNNTEAIKETLKTVVRNHQNNGPPSPPRAEYVAQFRWDRLAGTLARTFDEALCDER